MTRRGLSWRVRLPVLGTLALLALLVVGAGRPSAEPASGFGASSSAFGARVTVTMSKAPLVPNIVDGGGPLAQTTLDSLGTSIALASFPYPGDVVLNLPGLAAGLGPQLPGLVSGLPGVIGAAIPGLPADVLDALAQVQLPPELIEPLVAQSPPLPPYPFAAQADAFTPHDEVDLGVGKLVADASSTKVVANAASAPGASGTLLVPLEATSRIEQADDGGVVVVATGTISGLRVGPIVFGSVTSTARIERAADGSVERTSSFRATGIEVGALTLDLTPDGFVIGGNPVPAPIAATVNGALASAGLELRLLPKVETDSAVVAGGLELVRTQDFGPLGDGSVKLILGQSSARLDNATALPTPAASDAPAPPAVGASDALGSVGSAPAGVLPSPRTPAGNPGGTPIETTRAVAAEPFDATGLYLLLIAAAAVIVLIGPALRVLPLRARASAR